MSATTTRSHRWARPWKAWDASGSAGVVEIRRQFPAMTTCPSDFAGAVGADHDGQPRHVGAYPAVGGQCVEGPHRAGIPDGAGTPDGRRGSTGVDAAPPVEGTPSEHGQAAHFSASPCGGPSVRACGRDARVPRFAPAPGPGSAGSGVATGADAFRLPRAGDSIPAPSGASPERRTGVPLSVRHRAPGGRTPPHPTNRFTW